LSKIPENNKCWQHK